MSADSSSPITQPSLLVRLRDAQDAEAWRTFVYTYAPLVHDTCRRRGLQEADADDVTQAVMAEVLRCMRAGFEYQPGRGRFRNWLGTVTFRQIAHLFRDHAPEGAGTIEDLDRLAAPDSTWTEEFDDRVFQTALQRIQGDFEPATWRAFEQVWLENRPALETAGRLGVTIDVVYAAKSRVLKRLSQEILVLAEDLPHFAPLD
jgi:RNA polymerase sigma-70 factor (ECF subfamily)